MSHISPTHFLSHPEGKAKFMTKIDEKMSGNDDVIADVNHDATSKESGQDMCMFFFLFLSVKLMFHLPLGPF